MKKYILGAFLSLGILVSPVFMSQAEAAMPTAQQVGVIVQLLQAFGIDQSVINNVQSAMGGGGSGTVSGATGVIPPAASASSPARLTFNNVSSATNVDPLQSRTWAWSSVNGSSYAATATISGCEDRTQNGTVSNWKPWEGNGTAANGSTSTVPGSVKYGCTIVASYTVTTTGGQVSTATATATFRSSSGGSSGGLTITNPTVLHQYRKGGAPYIQLAYTGGSGTPTWSILSGAIPRDLFFDATKGTIEGNRIPADMTRAAEGVVTFTVKVTVGSQSATKQFSIEEISASDPRPVASDLVYGLMTNAYMSQTGNRALHFGSSMAYTSNESCSVVSGQLPPGTAMDSAKCELTGIPSTVGSYSFVYKVQNQYGSDTATMNIEVTNPARIRILTESIPFGKVGVPYNATLIFQADPGIQGVYQSGDRINLPPGLSYVYEQGGHSLTAAIVGTPTKAGSYQINVGVSAGGNTNIGEEKIFFFTVFP